MSPSLITPGLVMSVCVLVDFETYHDIRSDDDAVDERMGLICVDASVIDAIFSLSHVDVMLVEEAEERMLVFLSGKTTRLVRIARETICFFGRDICSHGTWNTIISWTYFTNNIDRIFWFFGTLRTPHWFSTRKSECRLSLSTNTFFYVDNNRIFWFFGTLRTPHRFLSRKSEIWMSFSTNTLFLYTDRIFGFFGTLRTPHRFLSRKSELWLSFSANTLFCIDVDRIFRFFGTL
ncbi:hypothetical protein AR158_C356L [Paramecium bursaria Chlorella virus AR158]|uniref:hypothetical protein n=1 Tax=Paramecium bursaria Chlorella virus AR158 TaxID=380598 RepID=UPI00015AA94B|nr:hypothetical protein AR158_C356L [Paramecium bursaria Chlorella virus AR158]ABU43901.1 hypothetical protein AR158_C356L [Paramecium bursaria Chlorella virus AR158]